MPIESCQVDGNPGKRWGKHGKCYTYTSNNKESLLEAKKKAIKQGIRIEGPENFKKIMQSDGEDYSNLLCDLIRSEAGIDLTYNELFTLFDTMGLNLIEQASLLQSYDAFAEYISKEERDKTPKEDFGDPENKKYPIRNQKDLEDAAKLVGRSKHPAMVKENLIKIAKRKKLEIPKAWESE